MLRVQLDRGPYAAAVYAKTTRTHAGCRLLASRRALTARVPEELAGHHSFSQTFAVARALRIYVQTRPKCRQCRLGAAVVESAAPVSVVKEGTHAPEVRVA